MAQDANRMREAMPYNSLIDNEPSLETHEWPSLPPAAEQYRQTIAALDKAEMEQLYKQELQKYHEEQDQQRFFNQPDAIADFEYWSRAAHWTLDEAIALTFGKDPRVVTWSRLEKILSHTSPFSKKFRDLRELTARAKKWEKLYDPVLPSIYIAWARQNDIEFSKKLEEMLVARGNHIPNWKKAYDALLEKSTQNLSETRRLLAEKDKLIQDTFEKIKALEIRKSAIEEKQQAQAQARKAPEKPLKTVERATVCKMIIGMAMDAYGYNPNSSKSTIAKELEGILDRLGMSVSDDTIRRWLTEAAELLPPSTE